MEQQYFIYILTNTHNTTLYIGVTNDLVRRVYEHRNKIVKGFSFTYNLTKLVYYEIIPDISQAIIREKQLKGGSRQKKKDLVDAFNPEWIDLYDKII